MRCSGQGTVYLANLAQYVHVVDVDQDGLTVDSSYVLALDSSLHTEVIAVDSQYGISGTGKYQLNITGRGKVALMTSGQPLMMQVTPDKYVNVRRRRDRRLVHARCGCRCRPRRTPAGCGGAAATPARAGSSASSARASRWSSPASCCRRRTPQIGQGAARPVRHGPAGRPRPEPEQRLELTGTSEHGVRGGLHGGRPLRTPRTLPAAQARAVASSSRTTDASATSATSS